MSTDLKQAPPHTPPPAPPPEGEGSRVPRLASLPLEGEGGQRVSAGRVGSEVSRSTMPASPGLTQQED
jgi:hypothetical protein